MHIVADIYPPNPHARIIGSLRCAQFNDLKTVEFVVDSGATFTTLLPYHVNNLGIDIDILRHTRDPCYSATGDPIYPYILPNVELHLDKNDGKPRSEVIFTLPFIHCMPSLPPNVIDQIAPLREITTSLVGMDVLRHFSKWTWDFEKGEMYLDR